MAKAARVNSTPRRKKSSQSSNTDRAGQGDVPAKIDTTNAKGPIAAAAAEEKSNHYGNAEEQICDLLRASDLSASLLERLLTEGRIDQDSASIYLPHQFAERLIFAAYQVRERAEALKAFMTAGGFD
jgi:hypothetical protein